MSRPPPLSGGLLRYRTRKYRGRRKTRTRLVRLVAIRNADTGDYHLYLTNVPPERLTAADVAKTYALRWQAESFFKAMRSHGHLGQLPSSKRAVVEVLVWASVLATLASQALYRMVRESVCRTRHMPPLRWAALFARIAGELLDLIVRPSSDRDRALFDRLRHDGPDPNRSRRDRSISAVPVAIVA